MNEEEKSIRAKKAHPEPHGVRYVMGYDEKYVNRECVGYHAPDGIERRWDREYVDREIARLDRILGELDEECAGAGEQTEKSPVLKLNDPLRDLTNKRRLEREIYYEVGFIVEVAYRMDDSSIYDDLIRRVRGAESKINLYEWFLICDRLLDYIDLTLCHWGYIGGIPRKDRVRMKRGITEVKKLFADRQTYVVRSKQWVFDSWGRKIDVYKGQFDLGEMKGHLLKRAKRLQRGWKVYNHKRRDSRVRRGDV
jgi:hypothetical protein